MRKGASAIVVLALAASWPAGAQTLYKWIDAQGKTQYSDRPPLGFKGEVTRIETEIEKVTLPPNTAPRDPAPLPVPEVKPEGPPDIATRRRTIREQLEARLAQARTRVESARKALAEAEPGPDERQVIQQRRAGGGMHGMNSARSNCRWEGTGKQKVLMCPTSVPNEEYHDRVAKLEEEVRAAEENLAAAEQAWRRGVD